MHLFCLLPNFQTPTLSRSVKTTIFPHLLTLLIRSPVQTKALHDGLFKEEDVIALETNRRLSGKYRGLRACEGRFDAMLERGKAEEEGADPATLPASEVLYAEYITCASGALCEKSMLRWTSCLESVQAEKKSYRECDHVKKLLERCMRSTTEDLLKAAQPKVFRPSAAP